MRAVDLGFRPEHVTTASYSLPQQQYATQPAVNAFNNELVRRLRQLPGVESVGLTSFLPASGNNNNQAILVEGHVPQEGREFEPGHVFASDRRLLPRPGDSVVARALFDRSRPAGTQLVVMVNRKLAEHFLAKPKPDRETDAHRHTRDADSVDDYRGRSGGREAELPGRPDERAVYFPVDQVEEAVVRSRSPGDLNGNGGYIALRSSFAAGADEKTLSDDGAVDRSATAVNPGADDGASSI